MLEFLPTTVPGFNTLLQPTSTSSPSIAPNFFSPVSICSSAPLTTTSFLSDFTLEVMEPAPYGLCIQEQSRRHSCNAEPVLY